MSSWTKYAPCAASEAEHVKSPVKRQRPMIRDLASKLDQASRKAQPGFSASTGRRRWNSCWKSRLRRQFPFDDFSLYTKASCAGIRLHVLRDSSGRDAGTYLSKSAPLKSGRRSRLSKLKGDQRSTRADLAVIVSGHATQHTALQFEINQLRLSSLSCTLPVAMALRASLLQLAINDGRGKPADTSELVYTYLTGPLFLVGSKPSLSAGLRCRRIWRTKRKQR